VQLQIIAV